MLAKCFFVGFLSITSPVSRKPRMWSPTYTGTALSESPANQVAVRVVEASSWDASVWALRHAARAWLKRARIDANESSSVLRSEEHTSELQSQSKRVCRLLLE